MPIIKGKIFEVQDVYVDYEFEEVMYRWSHVQKKAYVKFYGEEENGSPVPDDSKLFNDALLYGEQISKLEYDLGKSNES